MFSGHPPVSSYSYSKSKWLTETRQSNWRWAERFASAESSIDGAGVIICAGRTQRVEWVLDKLSMLAIISDHGKG